MTRTITSTGLITAIRGCASWQDIQAKWRIFPEKQKGDLFEELIKAYLQLEPEYASKLKHVWPMIWRRRHSSKSPANSLITADDPAGRHVSFVNPLV